MVDTQIVRDWEVCEAISDLSGNSYDFVGRDFPIGDVKADIVHYRRENYLVEAGFVYSRDDENAMERLESVRQVLMDNAFTPRLFTENADSARPDYEPELSGEYFLDNDASEEVIINDLEDLIPSDKSFSDLSKIQCKK